MYVWFPLPFWSLFSHDCWQQLRNEFREKKERRGSNDVGKWGVAVLMWGCLRWCWQWCDDSRTRRRPLAASKKPANKINDTAGAARTKCLGPVCWCVGNCIFRKHAWWDCGINREWLLPGCWAAEEARQASVGQNENHRGYRLGLSNLCLID